MKPQGNVTDMAGAVTLAMGGLTAEQRVAEPAPLAIGLQARRLNARLCLLHYRPMERLLRRWGIKLADLGRFLLFSFHCASALRTQSGVPIATQLRAQWSLAFAQGIDPSVYYMDELYRPGQLAKVDRYFLRREVKGLVMEYLHRLRAPAAEHRVNLGDKLQVAAWCLRGALPHPAPLMLIEDGQVVWQTGTLLDLDQDLFIKPRTGRGATGVTAYRRVSAFQYKDASGQKRKLGDIVSELIRKNGARNLIVQPLLRNHPELTDLTTNSLAVIRAVTCFNEQEQPELTVAYFRILTKLEPDWPVKKPISEYAAAIDLKTGTLGQLTGDKPECLSDWHDRHPVTGAEITGRVLPCWDQVVALAERAHRVISDRILIGWDIAITPTGPVLIEGNSYPDMHYPQRIHKRPYGEMRIGQLLQHHMARLEAKLDTKRISSGR